MGCLHYDVTHRIFYIAYYGVASTFNRERHRVIDKRYYFVSLCGLNRILALSSTIVTIAYKSC